MVGAVIGAGFASGREIVSFFSPLRSEAWLGLSAAALVLSLGGFAVVRVSSSGHLRNYGALFRAGTGSKVGSILDAVVTGFLFLTASVTLAGGGALLAGFYALPGPVGLAVTASAAALLVRRGHLSLFSGSALLAPLLILVLVLIVFARATVCPSPPPGPGLVAPQRWDGLSSGLAAAASGVLYGAYNLILGSGVLVAGARYRSKGGALAGALAAGIVLGLLAAAVLVGCVRGGATVLESQIPIAVLAERLPAGGFHLYALVFGVASITTLGAIAVSLAERCSGPARNSVTQPALFLVLALPVATLGFARLVRTVYPVLGLLGILWLGLWAISTPRQE
jgi:uncharacterized membrane protein YkvI